MTTERKVKGYIQAEGLLKQGDAVVIGVSGGADSVCLFLLLADMADKWELSLAAVHVNHGIRGAAAKEDAEFVENFCRKYGVVCCRENVDVPALAAKWKCGEEEAGRRVRHEAYLRCSEKHFGGKAKVALGHHRNDLAESVMLSLIRGAGLTGLSGIRPQTQIAVAGKEMTVIRPLLDLERDEIEAYLNNRGQAWRTDATNAEDEYARNRIRHQLIPLFEDANPKAVEHIARTALLAGQAEDYIAKQAKMLLDGRGWELTGIAAGACQEDKDGLINEDGELKKEVLAKLHPALAGEAVRQWLVTRGVGMRDLTHYHIVSIVGLAGKPVGKKVGLPGGYLVESGYGTLRLRQMEKDAPEFRLKRPQRTEADSAVMDDAAEKSSILRIKKPALGQSFTAQFGGYSFTFTAKEKGGSPKSRGKDENSFSIFINYDKIDEICLRFPEEGDRMVISRGGRHKKLRRILIDAKVPREERAAQVLLTDGKEVIWVVGIRDCPAYFVTEEAGGVLECFARRICDE